MKRLIRSRQQPLSRAAVLIIGVLLISIIFFLLETGLVSEESLGLLAAFAVLSLIIGLTCTAVYGLALAPWGELKKVGLAGMLTFFSVPVIQAILTVRDNGVNQGELFFESITGGVVLLAIAISVGLTTGILLIALLLRVILKQFFWERGGIVEHLTPEQRVLSDEELENFDDPYKNIEFLNRALPHRTGVDSLFYHVNV